jgi:hypothetical protein
VTHLFGAPNKCVTFGFLPLAHVAPAVSPALRGGNSRPVDTVFFGSLYHACCAKWVKQACDPQSGIYIKTIKNINIYIKSDKPL